MPGIADSGLHQQLRCVDRAQRHDHLESRSHPVCLAGVLKLDACDAAAIEQQSTHQRVGENGKVLLAAVGPDVRVECGFALPGTDANVLYRCAAWPFHHGAVVAVESRKSHAISAHDDCGR
jgi:hypothetical protein